MRITNYKPIELHELRKTRIKSLGKIAIFEELKNQIKILADRAKPITKRETKKIELALTPILEKSNLGAARVSFARKYSSLCLEIDLHVAEKLRPEIGHAWWINLFDISYQTWSSYAQDKKEWLPEYPDRDLSIEYSQKYLEDFPAMLADYPKINGILKQREDFIENAIEQANKLIPDYLWPALDSYSS